MKRAILIIARVAAAGLTAAAILCAICFFYYRVPVHVESRLGNTDYVWPAGSRWFRLTEGLTWGRYDENGFNNLQSIDSPDILLLGSSHMEATNVLQHQTTASRLNRLLDGRYTVYNQGISGHHFLKVLRYLPATLAGSSPPPQVIVIETGGVRFTDAEIDALLQGAIEAVPDRSDTFAGMLQRLPFVRLAYHQLSNGLLNRLLPDMRQSAGTPAEAAGPEAYDAMFSFIDRALEGYDVQLVIVYHPTGLLQPDGSIEFPADGTLGEFARQCSRRGIVFLDMTEPFLRMYDESHAVPHGFVTGAVAQGHLNADGHAAIARALADIIDEMEAEAVLCK